MDGLVLIAGSGFRLARQLEAHLAVHGFDSVIATNAGDALEIPLGRRVEAVLLPAGDEAAVKAGLCKALRAGPSGANLSILAITDPLEPHQDLILLDGGSDDCLAWPEEQGALVARLRSLIEMGRRHGGRSIGGDTNHGTFRDAGRALHVAIIDPVPESRARLLAALHAPGFRCSVLRDLSQIEVEGLRPEVVLVADSRIHGAKASPQQRSGRAANLLQPRLLLVSDRVDSLGESRLGASFDDVILRPIRFEVVRPRVRCAAIRAGCWPIAGTRADPRDRTGTSAAIGAFDPVRRRAA
jgi:DNA-binding response OmpR family regulator